MPFKKGQSGNAAGREKLDTSRRSIAAAAREYGEEALDTLATIMRDGGAPAGARIDAASKLIDRGFGKPTEHKQVSNVDALLSDLTDDELADALAVLRAAGGPSRANGNSAPRAPGAQKPH